ncbi:MAG: hypothetical protein LUE12_01980 [Ruminococcus sp.]|nr:hypothetical protein [Ruminococcus sp.]
MMVAKNNVCTMLYNGSVFANEPSRKDELWNDINNIIKSLDICQSTSEISDLINQSEQNAAKYKASILKEAIDEINAVKNTLYSVLDKNNAVEDLAQAEMWQNCNTQFEQLSHSLEDCQELLQINAFVEQAQDLKEKTIKQAQVEDKRAQANAKIMSYKNSLPYYFNSCIDMTF